MKGIRFDTGEVFGLRGRESGNATALDFDPDRRKQKLEDGSSRLFAAC